MMKRLPQVLAALSLAMAGGAGFLVASAGGQQAPARTVTLNVGTGEQGAPGPPGPKGEPGAQGPKGEPGDFTCIGGYSPGVLVINHPGGHVTVYTCIED